MKIYLRNFEKSEQEKFQAKFDNLPYYKLTLEKSEFDLPGIIGKSTTAVVPFLDKGVMLCITDDESNTQDFTELGGDVDFRETKRKQVIQGIVTNKTDTKLEIETEDGQTFEYPLMEYYEKGSKVEINQGDLSVPADRRFTGIRLLDAE